MRDKNEGMSTPAGDEKGTHTYVTVMACPGRRRALNWRTMMRDKVESREVMTNKIMFLITLQPYFVWYQVQ